LGDCLWWAIMLNPNNFQLYCPIESSISYAEQLSLHNQQFLDDHDGPFAHLEGKIRLDRFQV